MRVIYFYSNSKLNFEIKFELQYQLQHVCVIELIRLQENVDVIKFELKAQSLQLKIHILLPWLELMKKR